MKHTSILHKQVLLCMFYNFINELQARQILRNLCRDCPRASKSLATRPCNLPFVAKHMLLCLPGLCHLENIIMTQNFNSLFQDFAPCTTLLYHDISCIFKYHNLPLLQNTYFFANSVLLYANDSVALRFQME
jgi:hypothetical protein